ncbi:long-chain fatty acid--CoA ligase [uncultured Shewanella sp.]|uniref:AMP-dependent synthetase/ligase n=1 Tax=uncultured Shewanella sp. TaxID=173975 RepID=UPI002625DDA8|nr:long-chain fatty acid--CoA ligase [uncultured Shewanella sp.]
MSLEQYHVIRLIQQKSQSLGEAIALKGFEMTAPWDSVSWSQFDEYTSQIARILIQFGLQSQDKAVILSQNCPQWTCADVGMLKAKAVVVPIYPTSTVEQAAYIIKDCQAKIIFAGDELQYQMACQLLKECDSATRIIVFDANVNLIDQENHFHLDALLSQDVEQSHDQALQQRLSDLPLDDILTLIYTSGTTGAPKGVILDHRNVATIIRQHDSELNFETGDVSLAFLPLSHVFERGWSFYVLGRGGCNVYLQDPMKVKEAITQVRPHTLCVVPRFLEKVYGAVQEKVAKAPEKRKKLFDWALSVGEKHFEVGQGRAKGSLLLSLQFLLANKLIFSKLQQVLGGRLKFMPCGGAALEGKVAGFFHSINLPVLCGYGMTETSATVTLNTLTNRVTGSNGQPLPGVEIKIGKDNEILVKGDTVMRGYYNRPEATEETFEDGWLKTGDAGFIDENGNLFITDRIKELMKTSNGKYIAPQRVEGKVGCDPLIEQVAIVADAKHYVTALIVPSFESLEIWAKDEGVDYSSSLDLLRHSKVIEHFEQRLHLLQDELAGFEKIKKFTLLADPFSMESGLITPTMKLRRKMIYHKYSQEIDAMYT